MPEFDVRDWQDEVATLRQELAEAEARGYQRAIDELLAVPSHESHVAADWLEARRAGREPTFGHTDRDEQDEIATLRQELAEAMAELDRLRPAATRVVQLADRDQTIATHEAIGQLRAALREGGGQ